MSPRTLIGIDVPQLRRINLIHWLANNMLSESTGWKDYALFTNQGLERMQTDKDSFVQQTKSYEHLGDMETYVRDVQVRHEAIKAY